MTCLIMSCVIFCAAKDVTGVRKEHRGKKTWEGRESSDEHKDNNGWETGWIQTKWEKETAEWGSAHYGCSISNNITSAFNMVICPHKTYLLQLWLAGATETHLYYYYYGLVFPCKHCCIDFSGYISSQVCLMCLEMQYNIYKKISKCIQYMQILVITKSEGIDFSFFLLF